MALPTPTIFATESVTSENEIALGGNRFRLARPPRRVLTSIQAPRFTIGDTQRGADQRASILTWNDWRGGIGFERGLDSTSADRSWWSTCQQRFKEHLVLPRKAVATTAVDASGSVIGTIDDLANEVYCTKGVYVYKYNNETGSWGSSLVTLPAAAVSSLSDRVGGTVYLVFFCNTGYVYTTDGASFTARTTNGDYGVVWRNQLWMIDSTGQLRSNYDLTTEADWETDAQLPVPDDAVTGLFISRDAFGEFIIYASTKRGIYAHDANNRIFHPTEPRFPRHTKGALGSNDWSEAIYVPVGLSVYKRVIGSGGATSTTMGPDRDHGLPQQYRGSITTSAAAHNELLVGTSTSVSTEIIVTGGTNSGGHRGSAIFTETDLTEDGYAVILGWNDISWEVKWVAEDLGQNIEALFVTDAYSTANVDVYRMWWGYGATMYYIDIEADVVNPDQIGNQVYATEGTHITPWFDGGDVTHEKLALGMTFITKNLLDDTREIVVYYDTDFSGSFTEWKTLGTDTDGRIVHTFDDGDGNPVGLSFYEIQFKFVLSGAADATVSPDLPTVEFRWREKLNPKYGWQLVVDHTETYGGLTPDEQREALQGIIDYDKLVQMTYKNADADQSYWVDVMALTGVEATGLDNAGSTSITVVES